jgi:hypothetical protein
MSITLWPREPIPIIQSFEQRQPHRGPTGALIMWAIWSVESLHYLADLTDKENNGLGTSPSHDLQVKEISHIRWATGSAISSLDLCAAVLARTCCGWSDRLEADLRKFYPSKKYRSMIPSNALDWVNGVLSDTRYTEVHEARNSVTHSRLIRDFYLSSPTTFRVPVTGNAFTARELVVLSKELATDKVQDFLNVVDAL